MQTKTRQEQADREVARWREDRLAEAGFPPTLARQLSTDSRYDLHALIELVERGCQPDLAVRILAPLGDVEAA